jgi:ubiquinone/menaquinone biosynthesis C-methylase UbiE
MKRSLKEPAHARITSSAANTLDQLINGFRVTPLLYVAARLRLADYLQESAKTASELAALCGANESALYRVLRTLGSLGIFSQNAQGAFEMTQLAEPLCEDAPHSRRASALMWGLPSNWRSYGELLHTVMTGETAFKHVFKQGVFDYYENHHDEAKVFNAYMTERSRRDMGAIARAYDFTDQHSVVDIGGGEGLLLCAVLEAHAHLQGVLFEQASVVPNACARLKTNGLQARCKTVVGNFFEDAIPDHGDVYLMKWILHDWDDAQCLKILRNCYRSMPAHGRLLIVEQMIQPDNVEAFRTDIAMLLITGGRERTEREYRALCRAAGFRVVAIHPTGTAFYFIEAEPCA